MSQPLPPHERYQFKPTIGSSHTWALNQVMQLPTSSRILDVGSGSGAIGRELKERGYADISAIEVDPGARAFVKDIYREVHATLEAYQGKTYDVILLLDVLEHMPTPEHYIEQLIPYLSESGIIIFSVPNIAHWSIRIPLLFGYFSYTERGLLDKTHLQFFTRARLRKALAHRELSLDAMSVSIEPVELILPRYLWNNPLYRALAHVRLFIAQLLPGLCGFQILARVKRKNASVQSSEAHTQHGLGTLETVVGMITLIAFSCAALDVGRYLHTESVLTQVNETILRELTAHRGSGTLQREDTRKAQYRWTLVKNTNGAVTRSALGDTFDEGVTPSPCITPLATQYCEKVFARYQGSPPQDASLKSGKAIVDVGAPELAALLPAAQLGCSEPHCVSITPTLQGATVSITSTYRLPFLSLMGKPFTVSATHQRKIEGMQHGSLPRIATCTRREDGDGVLREEC
jgi:SAM-dependent methyltransferase